MFLTPECSFKTPSSSKLSLKSRNNNFTPMTDRFIPNRSLNNMECSHHLLTSLSVAKKKNSTNSENYIVKRKLFSDTCSETVQAQNRVLRLSCKTISRTERDEHLKQELSIKYHTCMKTTVRTATRVLPTLPETVLDAPNIIDDYYLNLFDWSAYNGKIAVGMGNEIFIWNQNTQTAESIPWNESSASDQPLYITSVKWMPNKNILSVAKSNHCLYLWDVCTMKCIAHIRDHESRVTSISWNDCILSSGDKNGIIMNHDIRSFNMNKISEYKFHTGDVCRLAWSPNGRFLASGADDRIVSIWDKSLVSSVDNLNKPMIVMREHKAAVKAIDWCPWNSGFLASGGGKQDGTIKLWNIYTGGVSKNLETNSQITSLLWASNTKELISSHGCPYNNLSIWTFPNLDKVGDIMGHSDRILGMSLSPNGDCVASLASDETLRLWECFKVPQSKSLFSTPLSGLQNIR
jgi:cell division cycle protein 20 (cofactor of APC complex)